MADLEARREARRRRILENAKFRLQKITNALNDEGEGDEHNLNTDSVSSFSSAINDPQEENNEIETNEAFTSLFQNGNFNDRSSASLTYTENVEKDRNVRVIVIMGLATFTLLLQLLVAKFNSFGDKSLVNKVFAPFLLYEFIDVFLIKRRIEPNALTNLLVLFANIPPRVSGNAVALVNTFLRVTQDLFIYFFIYVSVNLLLESVY